MEWDPFLSWEFGHAPPGAPGQATDCRAPSDLDVWLVQLTYGFVAGESKCLTCTARLSREVRVEPFNAPHATSRWGLSVLTRCEGWRRHRHHANVVLAPQGLLFGAFAAGRPAA
jgi:hypothetical protein